MGPWSEHGNAWYSCNRYEERDGVEARDAQSKSRASLERYLHVCDFTAQCHGEMSSPLRLFTVLQSMGESRAVCAPVIGSVRQDREKDAGDAGDLGVDLDPSPIRQEGRGRGDQVPDDAQVDICHGLLSWCVFPILSCGEALIGFIASLPV